MNALARQDAPDVLWVAGAGHSGSTLLGLMLGTHSRVFYAGEAKKASFLHDETKPLRKRTCKLCGTSCPVWSDFPKRPMNELYATLANKTGASLIVDSTKGLSWLRERMSEVAASRGKGTLVFLGRDGRAVVSSRLRKYPGRAPSGVIDRWREQIEGTEALFAVYEGPKLRVAYEDLAREPAIELRRVCEAAGLPYEETMLEFADAEHHPLGGNNGTQSQLRGSQVKVSQRHGDYYARHGKGVRLDERWRDELSDSVRREFERRAGDINQPFRREP